MVLIAPSEGGSLTGTLQITKASYRGNYSACRISLDTLQKVRLDPFWKKTSMSNSTTFLAGQEMLNRYGAVPVLNKKKESK
jgi:hypothetical protein